MLDDAVMIKARAVMPTREVGGPLNTAFVSGVLDSVTARSGVSEAAPTEVPFRPSIAAPRVVKVAGSGLEVAEPGNYCEFIQIAFETTIGDGPYTIYTLDGSEPDFYGSHTPGVDPTQVWDDLLTRNGNTLDLFDDAAIVTVKARNVQTEWIEDQYHWVTGHQFEGEYRLVNCD